jgi:hypothetical protein
MKTNQKGFGVIGIFAVVIIIGLTGAVGWLVYNKQKSKTDNKNTTAQTSQQTNEQAKPVAKDEVKSNYFEVKELGVKFELSDNLSGLYYSMGNNNKTAYFSLNEFKGTECAADKIAQVALSRYSDDDFEQDLEASKDNARKIGAYYYLSAGGQAACSEDMNVQEKATNLRTEILRLLPENLQLIEE